MKAFKSKQMMCDVGAEQRQQMKLKQKREARDKQAELDWHQEELRQMDEFDQALKAKLEAQHNKKMANAQMINRQLEEFKERYVKGMQEEMLEGELLKQQVVDGIEQEKQREYDRILLNKKVQAQQLKANRELEEMKEEQRRLEIEEDRKIEQFRLKKERLDQLRKEKEADRIQKKVRNCKICHLCLCFLRVFLNSPARVWFLAKRIVAND